MAGCFAARRSDPSQAPDCRLGVQTLAARGGLGRVGRPRGSVAIRLEGVEFFWARDRQHVDQRILVVVKKLVGGNAVFFDQGVVVEGFFKNGGGVVQQVGFVAVAAQSGRGAHTGQVVFWGFKAVFEAAQQAGQVSTLRPVEGVKLIDDDVTQGFGAVLVVLPEGLGIGLDQQIIQHFIVGQQNVGGLARRVGLSVMTLSGSITVVGLSSWSPT